MKYDQILGVIRSLIELDNKSLIDKSDLKTIRLMAMMKTIYAANMHPKDFDDLCNIMADFCTVAGHNAEVRADEQRKASLN